MQWLESINFPTMAPAGQCFPERHPVEAVEAVEAELERGQVLKALPRGARVAVGVGSRGIDQLAPIVHTVLRQLESAGARPFIVPAMGSHGAATEQGQLRLLADYGVTAEAMQVPIEAGMEADTLGVTEDGAEVFVARAAWAADGILLINRVKPHTDFGGSIGSGLLKMLVVGLGKHAGALAFHRAAQRIGHERALRTMASVALRHGAHKILGGLGIIEDQRHRTARLEWVPGSRLAEAEPRLAAEAAKLMPRLPLEDLDLLIVDRIGKNISGTGMDPNVIGRMIHGYSLIENELPTHPRIRRIFVRDLSPESHGNATGIGMADFTTDRLVEAMGRDVTYTNALTALSLQGSKVPITLPNDRLAVAAALSTLGLDDTRAARVVRIRDTLSLERMQVSEACLPELQGRAGVTVTAECQAMRFDAAGNLPPLGD